MTLCTATLTRLVPLTAQITEFTLEGDDLPPFAPGAHIRVELPDGDTRAYSLIRMTAADAAVASYTIAVQREDGGKGGSRFMHGLREGVQLRFAPPKCDFPVDTGAPAVLLAGGIGVTPLISMAAALDEAGQAFAFHYAARSAGVMAYRDALAARFGDRVHLHFDDDASALNLEAVIGALGQANLYICGPRGLIDTARTRAEAAGIAAGRVHVELFDTPAPVQGETGFEVELSSSGQVFTVAPGQSIIDALEAGGVDVLYDCRRGDCGICQCGVIEGVPDHRDVVLSAEERAAGNVMQICVSRAKTPRLVLDL
ncbi:PDR/VanB family oxidoreductase [Seohaeicola nanhaiensis]|uniref:PDR/VanB family oxidoreductase n=1 Tax=Seohaeicola nanhaiensis TaxID=1387282 RepID=A0ABV9KNS4_9RHOB